MDYASLVGANLNNKDLGEEWPLYDNAPVADADRVGVVRRLSGRVVDLAGLLSRFVAQWRAERGRVISRSGV